LDFSLRPAVLCSEFVEQPVENPGIEPGTQGDQDRERGEGDEGGAVDVEIAGDESRGDERHRGATSQPEEPGGALLEREALVSRDPELRLGSAPKGGAAVHLLPTVGVGECAAALAGSLVRLNGVELVVAV